MNSKQKYFLLDSLIVLFWLLVGYGAIYGLFAIYFLYTMVCLSFFGYIYFQHIIILKLEFQEGYGKGRLEELQRWIYKNDTNKNKCRS